MRRMVTDDRSPRRLAPLALVLLASVDVGSSAPPPRVANVVLDLHDGDLVLDSENGPATWESGPIDTARFTRVGLHVDGETESPSGLVCDVLWKFSDDDDAWLDPQPAVVIGGFPGQLPKGGPPETYGEVRGLRANVVCRTFYTGGPTDPFDPRPTSALLRDVRLLLRRP